MSTLRAKFRVGAAARLTTQLRTGPPNASGVSLRSIRYFQSAVRQNGYAGLAHAPVQDYPPEDFIDLGRAAEQPSRPQISSNQGPLVSKKVTGARSNSSASVTADELKQIEVNAANYEEQASSVPVYHRDSKFDRVPYWQSISRWKDISEEKFLSYRWGTANDIQGKPKLYDFLREVLPENIPQNEQYEHIRTRDDFLMDVMGGIEMAPMSIRMTPHILASINWSNPLEDPLRRQFIPMKSTFQPDHPKLTLDSLHETHDSPVEGLVHRYADKCLFLASSHCPTYCRYCTRSYAVGADTSTVTKASLKPKRARWNDMLSYIAETPTIQDVVLSGGDSYSLMPAHLGMICDRLLDIPHIRRFRVATKGPCVSPSRTLDPDDQWTDELIRVSNEAKQRGKQVSLHTHFNHPNEFSWVSREAAQKLFSNGVMVRNQSVLLRGVNDDVSTMGALIRELADNNIQPYYIYAGDLVRGVEDLRTPLQTILDLETQLRGTIAGFMTPQFVVDLPGGGGKRLAASYRSYNRLTGVSTFVAPSVTGRGKEGKVFEYYDPLASLPEGGQEALLEAERECQVAYA